MRRILYIFASLLATASSVAAQTSTPPTRFDTTFSVGLMSARMPEIDQPYYQDWYTQGRYAAGIGYYFTKHLKVEFEHAWSGEGTRQLLEYSQIGGQVRPMQVDQSFQLQQSTVRMVYQFRENQWVHPYLSAGAVLDIEQQHLHTSHTELRGGVSIGGGAKFYMTRNAYFNTGAIVTHSSPASTVNFIAGFGFDW